MAKSLQAKSSSSPAPGAASAERSRCFAPPKAPRSWSTIPASPPTARASNASPAEEVVEEIKKRGGTAVANFETVAEAIPASKIVKRAIDSFGKLDGVVNNAGILRDAIFHRMSVDAFESVIKVHLMGSFYVSHAAARLFREQESGSFVHFTSTSGLVGNFGQANYAAAKLGIVGLSKSIALDMNRFNVRSNCVSPFAWSRLIGTIPTETEAEKARVAKIQQMGPEKIAPVVAYPAQRSCQGRYRADLCRADERDFPDEPVAPAALGPSRRRLDAADHRRTRHAGAEVVVLQARPLGRHLQLGRDLARSHSSPAAHPKQFALRCAARFMPDCGHRISFQQKTWEEIMTTPLTFPDETKKLSIAAN